MDDQFKECYYRTDAALLTERMGATAARREWTNLHRNELAEGAKPPSIDFFKRNHSKFKTYGSVENRVFIFIILLTINYRLKCAF